MHKPAKLLRSWLTGVAAHAAQAEAPIAADVSLAAGGPSTHADSTGTDIAQEGHADLRRLVDPGHDAIDRTSHHRGQDEIDRTDQPSDCIEFERTTRTIRTPRIRSTTTLLIAFKLTHEAFIDVTSISLTLLCI
ncbi:hypothetical protein AAVH_18966 [Aphelenchoides avenae]|nr:hypothetical protein AAVH_18966 [Aphelenchus avenae]